MPLCPEESCQLPASFPFWSRVPSKFKVARAGMGTSPVGVSNTGIGVTGVKSTLRCTTRSWIVLSRRRPIVTAPICGLTVSVPLRTAPTWVICASQVSPAGWATPVQFPVMRTTGVVVGGTGVGMKAVGVGVGSIGVNVGVGGAGVAVGVGDTGMNVDVGVGVGDTGVNVGVGGAGVALGSSGVGVGGTGVAVGVAVGGTGVGVGGIGVSVGVAVAVGVAVGGTGVNVDVGLAVGAGTWRMSSKLPLTSVRVSVTAAAGLS